MTGFWIELLGFAFATVWRMVSCGVLAALAVGALLELRLLEPLMISFSVAGLLAPTACHAIGLFEAAGGVDFTSTCGTGPSDCCECCNRFRSFCDIFGAGRLKGVGASPISAILLARPRDSEEVRLDVEACAMISLISVLGAVKGVNRQD